MGMHQQKPCIWIDRKPFYPKGKIVFAANPADFGSRTKNCQVLNSSEVVLIDPIPLPVLYHDSVLPILNKTALTAEEKITVGTHWMQLYHHCLASEPGKPVISPRELETIALSFAAALKKNPQADVLELAKSIGYLFASTLVPEEQLAEFKLESFALMPLPDSITYDDGSVYVFVEEYQHAWTILQHLTDAIDFNNEHKLNKQVIRQLEILGPSNIGKSAFLRAAMHAIAPDKKVTCIDPSMLLDTQKEVLMQAAENDETVVHDEANMQSLQGSLEAILNPYLNGEDLEGKPLNNAFTYLSSGNPVKSFKGESFKGRCKRTFAGLRRQVALSISELSYASKQKIGKQLTRKQQNQGRLTGILEGVVMEAMPESALPRSELASAQVPAPRVPATRNWFANLFGRPTAAVKNTASVARSPVNKF